MHDDTLLKSSHDSFPEIREEGKKYEDTTTPHTSRASLYSRQTHYKDLLALDQPTPACEMDHGHRKVLLVLPEQSNLV